MQVDVYSKDPNLRLYRNDSLVGERPCTETEGYKVTFTIPYSAGTLKVVGTGPGGTADSAVLHTANGPRTITLTADHTTLLANGQDLCFIQVEIADIHGTIDPNADNRLRIEVDGPARLAGIANGDMQDLDTYAGNSRKAWHGRALLVLRTTHQTGKITLTVSATGLKKATMTLDASPIPVN